MKQIIKVGSRDSNIKYIILDKENKECKLVPQKKAAELETVVERLKGFLPEFSFDSHRPLSLEEEITFLWPQLVKEAREKFSSLGTWLQRAQIDVVDNNLSIGLETKLALKKSRSKRFLHFLKNRFNYYLGQEVNIKFHNGNFLSDIADSTIQPKKPPKKHSDKKSDNNKPQKQNNETAENNSQNSNFQELSLHGRKIAQSVTHNLSEIQSEKPKVVVKGEVFKLDMRKTRNGKKLYIISITDKINSVTAKLFLNGDKELKGELKEGDWLKIRGRVQYDTYNNELCLMANDLMKVTPEKRKDNSPDKRIEFHLHTQMSAMDSVVNVEEAVKKAADWGHEALAITDHGVVQAFPEAYQAGEEYGVKIIYGLEAYMVDDGEPIIVDPPEKAIDDTTFVVFDLETTGLNPKAEDIIEIGAVKLRGGEVLDRFSSLIKPSKSIPDKIIELTGINNEMVKDAPDISGILPDFLEFIEDTVLVAHNSDFDYSFLSSAIKRCGLSEREYSVLDTLALSRALLPDIKNHKLGTLAEYFKVNLENHHRAVDDAEATSQIMNKLIEEIVDQGYDMLPDINCFTSRISWHELPTYHTIIIAKNRAGLKDLYRLVSQSHIEHFYRKPRILKSELIQCRENLLIGSACEAGQLYRAFLRNKSEKEIKNIAGFFDYLEIQPLGNNEFLIPEQVESEEELKEINKNIYDLGKELDLPVIAACDVHFLAETDKIYREILQTGQKFDDADNQPPIYFRTTDEMLEEFSYLGDEVAREVVIENPRQLNENIEKLKPMPDGLYTPEIEGSDEQIREMSYNLAEKLYGNDLPQIVTDRLERELEAIIDNGYAVIYLISHKLVKKSLEDGYLVGSRGSVGSSLVATMCEITEVNPLPPHYRCPECKYNDFEPEAEVGVGIDLPDRVCPECGSQLIKDGFDIPFEVFMGFEGDKVPDIDLNFSGEYQSKIHKETEELFGEDYVFRAGTISTIADRTAFGFVRGYMDDNDLNLRKAEVDRLVNGCTGVRRTTGQHPGGLMVVPKKKDIHDFTPIQRPANDQETDVKTTHFDYHSISGRILKLDLLGHDDPTSIRMLQDRTGVKPDEIPLDDPETMSIFSTTEPLGVTPDEIGVKVGTLGIPEFGTSFVRQMLIDTKPTTFAELVRISGLSHGSDVWLNNAQDLIKNGTAELSDVISVRDDIMNYLLQKDVEPSRSFWIMEHVRKGKGLSDEEEKSMRQAGVPDWYIESCKKIKYMFPKAHAAAYVMMAFRIAYFKVHYPEAFYQTYFSIKAGDFDAQMVAQGFEFLKQKRKQLEEKGNDKTAKEKGTLTVIQIVLEAMIRGIEFTNVDLYNSPAYSFGVTDDGLLPPLISLQGLGTSAAENIAAAREEGGFKSVEDLVDRTGITKTVIEVLEEHGCISGLPEKNQLSLFQ